MLDNMTFLDFGAADFPAPFLFLKFLRWLKWLEFNKSHYLHAFPPIFKICIAGVYVFLRSEGVVVIGLYYRSIFYDGGYVPMAVFHQVLHALSLLPCKDSIYP